MRTSLGYLFLAIVFFTLGCGAGSGLDGPPSATSTVVASPNSDAATPHRFVTFRNVALYVSDENGVLPAGVSAQSTLFFEAKSQQGGMVRGYSEGSFFYTPPQDFVGTDSFRFTISHHQDQTEGRVEIQVREGASGLSIDLYGGAWQFSLVPPTDPQEFDSYLQAQIAGGALEGRTDIFQADAIPFTRFALVEAADLFHAAVARNYATQLAAESLGYDPLDETSLRQAAQEYAQMNPEAQLFLQVAAVFKGKLLDGPDEYDNAGLRDLLVSKGLGHFIEDPQIGDRDIPTLGAIGAAMNAGQLTIADVLNSGTFEDVERYDLVVEFVFDGRFKKLVDEYESVPFANGQ